MTDAAPPCSRKHCGEPGFIQVGSEWLCPDHFDDFVREDAVESEFDEHGRNREVMRRARAM